jgi:putative transposase
VIYRFIHAEKAHHRTRTLCRMLGVSRSGYYAWVSRPPSRRAVADQLLTERIRVFHAASRSSYGAPRIWLDLRDDGHRVSRKRVARLMREAQIRGAYRRRRRARSRPVTHPATDLVRRDFTARGPDRIWVADITYWPTDEGDLYLAAVMDLYSRGIVGWAMQAHLRADLVIEAIEMATTRRRPGPGLIHHSDLGSQYTSWIFGKTLQESQILQSMGRTGTAHDNAVIESFFATLKLELLFGRRYRTRAEAKAAIFEHIEVFYNRQRRHSTIGGVSPTEHERRYAERAAAV